MNRVDVFFTNKTKTKIDKNIVSMIKKVVRHAASTEYPDNLFELYIEICNENEIKELNRDYRNIDKITDVLSFPTHEFDFPQIKTSLGDIFICYQRAEAQAAEYGHGLLRELCFLALHGALHLCGFDHENDAEAAEMESKQETILKSFDIVR